MPLDELAEADILDWIGAAEDGEDIAATYALRGTVEATALSILKRRRAQLGPDAWALSGDYSESDGGRRAAWLDRQIARLAEATGAPIDQIQVGRISRCQPTR